jgi:hypothetical protein
MFLLLTIFAILISVSSVSAASTVYVNATGGNDSNTGTSDSPYQTISQGISSVDENGTVYIANGVYNGTGNTNITIGHNMSIIGQSQTGTIINGTGTNWIFKILSGVIVNINNLTFTNATTTDNGAAIHNSGTLAVGDCTFTGNMATGNYPYDFGGALYNSGTITNVIGCTFTNNTASSLGGAFLNYMGTINNITGCTFTNNTAIAGGALYNYGGTITTVNGCNFTNNTANSAAGAIASYNGGITSNVINCTFINNSVKDIDGLGGAIALWNTGTLNVHYSSFVNNTAPQGNAIHNFDGSVNAKDNWWGSNNPVWASLISGSVYHPTWLYMTMNATPTTITQSSLVTVSFNNHYNGATVTSFDPITGHIPDGTLVTFTSTLGSFNPMATTVNGIATALFTANQAGTDNLNATTDNQTVSKELTVNQGPTVTTVGGVTGYAGQNVTLTANVDCYGNPVNEGTVTFTIGSTTLTPVTITNGLATINWTIPTTWTAGNYTIVADYSGSSNYLASTNGTNLTVTPNPTNINVNPVSGYAGHNVTFTANLVDSNGNPVTDGQVGFKVNNTNIGTVDVSNGTASITWAIPTTWTAGNYSVVAEYSGSNNYLTSTNGTLLTLQPSSYLYLNTTTSKANPTVGETFLVTYKLGNRGPNNATNVTVSFQIPAGLEFVNVNVDNGTVTYNPTNRTVTWTLSNVEVGDPYLYLSVRALGSGSYSITPAITSETFNGNTDPLMPFSISVQAQNNSDSNTVNAASTTKTVPMQTTGMPIAGLILAILAVLGGMFTPRKK